VGTRLSLRPSVLREANELAKLGRNRAVGSRNLVPVAWYDGYWRKERLAWRGSTSDRVRRSSESEGGRRKATKHPSGSPRLVVARPPCGG
jgi:hypothetical protein